MRSTILFALLLAACSTIQSRRDNPPIFEETTAVSLQDFQGCFAERTAKQDVQYLPRRKGGTFSLGAGPQRYIFWVVDIDDLGTARRVKVHATGAKEQVLDEVSACL